MNQEEYNQDLDEELFIFHYTLIKKDIDILKKKDNSFFGKLVPDRIRWRNIGGYHSSITILKMAKYGNPAAEWLTYHLSSLGVSGFDRIINNADALHLIIDAAKYNFAPAMVDLAANVIKTHAVNNLETIDIELSKLLDNILSNAANLGSMDAYYLYYLISMAKGFKSQQSLGTEDALINAATMGHPDALYELTKSLININRNKEAYFYSTHISGAIDGYNNIMQSCCIDKSMAESLLDHCQKLCSTDEQIDVLRLNIKREAKSMEDMRSAMDDFYGRQLFHIGEPLYVYNEEAS